VIYHEVGEIIAFQPDSAVQSGSPKYCHNATQKSSSTRDVGPVVFFTNWQIYQTMMALAAKQTSMPCLYLFTVC
jgi:hypothetical protein